MKEKVLLVELACIQLFFRVEQPSLLKRKRSLEKRDACVGQNSANAADGRVCDGRDTFHRRSMKNNCVEGAEENGKMGHFKRRSTGQKVQG